MEHRERMRGSLRERLGTNQTSFPGTLECHLLDLEPRIHRSIFLFFTHTVSCLINPTD
jgi:hypothetical protein